MGERVGLAKMIAAVGYARSDFLPNGPRGIALDAAVETLRRLDPDDPANIKLVADVLRRGVISVEEDARAILAAIAGADNG